MRKYEYRVHWGKFWHLDPEYSPFETFGDDLANLKKRIEAYPNNKLKNCWVTRVLYGATSCSLKSNYQNELKRMSKSKPGKPTKEKAAKEKTDESQIEL